MRRDARNPVLNQPAKLHRPAELIGFFLHKASLDITLSINRKTKA